MITSKLRKAIQGKLTPICLNTYHIYAPAGKYPYITYETQFSTGEDEIQNCSIEINVVNYGTDTTAVEQMADEVQRAFSYCRYEDADVSFYSNINTRAWVVEEDKKIQRVRLLIDLTCYYKN